MNLTEVRPPGVGLRSKWRVHRESQGTWDTAMGVAEGERNPIKTLTLKAEAAFFLKIVGDRKGPFGG